MSGGTSEPRPRRPERAPPASGATEPLPLAADTEPRAPLGKAIAVLQTVAQSPRPLGLPELSTMLQMPKATVHRIVKMLESEGLIEKELGGRRLEAGRRLIDMAFGTIATAARSAARHAILEALSRRVGETCNLGIMVGHHAVYVDRVEATWPLGLRFEPGSRVPLHCTAIGKLFLSALPPRRCRQVLEALPLERYTDRTITDPDRLMAELGRIRTEGLSTDDQEFLAGVVCLAVPVRNAGGATIAALAVSAPRARLSMSEALRLVPEVREAADRLAASLVDAGTGDAARPGAAEACGGSDER